MFPLVLLAGGSLRAGRHRDRRHGAVGRDRTERRGQEAARAAVRAAGNSSLPR